MKLEVVGGREGRGMMGAICDMKSEQKLERCECRSGGIILRLRRRLRDRSGGVNMEYVILAVLVAAALLWAVVYFSRTIAKMFLTSSEAVTLEHTKAQSNLNKRRTELDKGRKEAGQYHDSMHK